MARQRLPKPTKSFGVPLYGGAVLFYRSFKAYNEAVLAVGGEALTPDCEGYFTAAANEDGHVIYLLGVFNRRRSVIAHEAAHLTMAILNRAGMDPRDSGGEAFCYLLGALLEELGIDK